MGKSPYKTFIYTENQLPVMARPFAPIFGMESQLPHSSSGIFHWHIKKGGSELDPFSPQAGNWLILKIGSTLRREAVSWLTCTVSDGRSSASTAALDVD